MTLQSLDNRTNIAYSAQTRSSFATEHYRLWDRTEHYGPTKEDCTSEQAASVGHGSVDDYGGSRGLQCQRADNLPGDQERQAQSLSAQQGLSHQARRSSGLVRGIGGNRAGQGRHESVGSIPFVYIGYTFRTQ